LLTEEEEVVAGLRGRGGGSYRKKILETNFMTGLKNWPTSPEDHYAKDNM